MTKPVLSKAKLKFETLTRSHKFRGQLLRRQRGLPAGTIIEGRFRDVRDTGGVTIVGAPIDCEQLQDVWTCARFTLKKVSGGKVLPIDRDIPRSFGRSRIVFDVEREFSAGDLVVCWVTTSRYGGEIMQGVYQGTGNRSKIYGKTSRVYVRGTGIVRAVRVGMLLAYGPKAPK